jgi:hypothetical protein
MNSVKIQPRWSVRSRKHRCRSEGCQMLTAASKKSVFSNALLIIQVFVIIQFGGRAFESSSYITMNRSKAVPGTFAELIKVPVSVCSQPLDFTPKQT